MTTYTAARGRLRLLLALPLVAVAALALWPASSASAANCPRWKVPTPLTVVQGNGYWVTFQLKQDGQRIWGQAGYAVNYKEWRFGATKTRYVIGNASGYVVGNRISLRVFWTTSGVSGVGRYLAEITPAGLIRNGYTWDEMARPAVSAQWYGREQLGCFWSG
jgi:hypothetical protein